MPSLGDVDDKKEAVEGGYEDGPCKLGFAMDSSEDWQVQPSAMKLSETIQTGITVDACRSKVDALDDLKTRCTQAGYHRTLSSVEELAFNCMEKIGGNEETFTADDVLAVVKEFENMRTDLRTMKHFFIGLVVCFILFSGTMFGLMWVSIEMTKDFHPEQNGMLKTPDGEAIGTSVVTHTLPLSALATMTRYQLRALETIDLTNGNQWSNHKVASVSKTSTAVIVQTQQGGTITANQDGGLFLGDSVSSGGGRRLNADDGSCSVTGTTEGTGETATTTCPGPIKINEVDARPPAHLKSSAEFVELYNAGSVQVDLTGWTVTEFKGTKGKFPDNRVIEPKSFLVVSIRNLNNGGDEVELRNADGCLVDQFSYSKSSKTKNWARMPDGGFWSSRQRAPTKGASNGELEVRNAMPASKVGCKGTCDGLCFATWNIQNLGTSKGNRPAVMDAIKSVIARYDLVAIQELSQKPAGPSVCGDNTESVICDSRPDATTYSVSASPYIGDEQYVIIAKQAAAKFTNIGAKYPDKDSVHSRAPYAFKVNILKGAEEWDLVVALTHTSPSKAKEEILNFPDVLNWMEGEFPKTGQRKQAIALVGDYNADGGYFKDEDYGTVNRPKKGIWSGSQLNQEFAGYELLTKNNKNGEMEASTTVTLNNQYVYDRIIADSQLKETAGDPAVFKLEDIDLSSVRVEGCQEGYVPSSLCTGDWANEKKGGLTSAGVWSEKWEEVDIEWRNILAGEISDHHVVEICLQSPA